MNLNFEVWSEFKYWKNKFYNELGLARCATIPSDRIAPVMTTPTTEWPFPLDPLTTAAPRGRELIPWTWHGRGCPLHFHLRLRTRTRLLSVSASPTITTALSTIATLPCYRPSWGKVPPRHPHPPTPLFCFNHRATDFTMPPSPSHCPTIASPHPCTSSPDTTSRRTT
jgi:hypothetical protein